MAYPIGILILVALSAWFAWRASGKTPSVPDPVRHGFRDLYASKQSYLRFVAGFATILIPVWLLLLFGVLASIWTLFFGERPSPDDAVAFRLHYLGIGSMVLAVLALVGAPLGLIRVWTSERQTRTAEQGHVTDLINKAVEGLGAEKTVSRIGRPVRYPAPDDSIHTEIQWEGDNPPDYPREEFGDWQTFNKTEPSLEIRIGAIYTLERIARENPEEHVRVMEILCAYIRENAPARDARPNPLDPFPDYPESPAGDDLQERRQMRADRKNRLQECTADLRANHAPRTDIQTALEVIGRRSEHQIAREGKSNAGGKWTGYRLDLRGANLQAADLADRPDRPMRFGHTRLYRSPDGGGGPQRGADGGGGPQRGADGGGGPRLARMEGADLGRGADGGGGPLPGADLRISAEWAGGETGAPAHSADLRGAKGLTQNQLDQMIGNAETLLPETLDDGAVPSIPSCWATPPPFFEAMIARMPYGDEDRANDLRAEFLCPDGTEPVRTGTPLALDAPYPDGHPLADRED